MTRSRNPLVQLLSAETALWTGMLLLAAAVSCCSSGTQTAGQNYQWAAANRLIAHALGGVDLNCYSNAKEAMTGNYAAGHRLFEVDLTPTRDNKIVCLHDWSPTFVASLRLGLPPATPLPMTYDQFLSGRIYARYTPLGAKDLMGLLKQYPDACIVTDTKITSGPKMIAQWNAILAAARAVDPAVLDRVIPQVYNQAMYHTLKALYPFKSWIYTLYQSRDTREEVVRFCATYDVRVVTMPASYAKPAFVKSLQEKGVYVYVHTINSLDEARQLQAQGVHGFYTDFLTPHALDYAPPGPSGAAGWTAAR